MLAPEVSRRVPRRHPRGRYDAKVTLVRSARDHDNFDDWRSTLAELAEEQLDLSTSELAAMTASPLWQLKVMVDEGAARGNDPGASGPGARRPDQ